MPSKPRRPCSHPGCPKLTHGRFCEEHTKQEAKRYELYDRDREAKAKYGYAWQKIRTAFLSEHPLCEVCASKGLVVAAEEVHHKKPLTQGGTHSYDNLMPLCKECHSEITAREGGRWTPRHRKNTKIE